VIRHIATEINVSELMFMSIVSCVLVLIVSLVASSESDS